MNNKPDISVIIPVKNGKKTIKRCLDSIFAQSVAPSMEVIIIDSGSTDRTEEIVSQYPVRLYNIKPEEFSHSGTRNYGVSLAKGEFIVFTVQDAWMANNTTIERAIKHFEDRNVVAVGGKQAVPHEPDKNPLQWYRPQQKPSVKKIRFDPGQFGTLPFNEQFKYIHLDNVLAIYWKEALEALPFPNVEFGEDMFWAKEALDFGWTIVYDQTILAWHYHHYDDTKKLKSRLKYQKQILDYFNINQKKDYKEPLKIIYRTLLKKNFVPRRKLYWLKYNLKLWWYQTFNK